jgi:cytochrome c oxidase subunit IV
MTTTEELPAEGHHDPHDLAGDAPDTMTTHKPNSYYIVVAVILAVITAVETSTYWIDFGVLFLPVLLILMTVKFFMVVMLFMHLKFDSKVFWCLFLVGLGLAVMVYVGALLTLEFFSLS